MKLNFVTSPSFDFKCEGYLALIAFAGKVRSIEKESNTTILPNPMKKH